jgi:hypothetical protein
VREWAGNSGDLRIWFGLRTPSSLNWARELPKVSDHVRENSRFRETETGDFGLIGNCVPMTAVELDRFSQKAYQFCDWMAF